MATQATSSSPSSTFSSSSSSSSSCPRWKYHVFLSFCGVDTRMNFTDHLYTALKQKSIITFRDDEKLERGKYISPELLKAIEESKYAIIVLSTNYAFSRWCLIELAKILKCKKETGVTVLPVFYHVDPSDVRNQNGILAEAFAKLEKDTRINTKDVQTWKAALKDVGDISGWHLHDRHESIIIQKIIGRIFSELYHKLPCVSEDLVGMDSCVEEMLDSYIGEGLGGVRFVGICGMGGMGKTTLAHEIYRRISGNFEARSFIANIREETKNRGLVSLQKQLLSKILMESEINIWDVCEGINVIRNTLCNKNVFIILDDVDGDEQLEALAGKHDWFGPGSRIIVTSRDSHLLIRCGVDYIYTTKELNNDDALQLFSWRAFHKPHPEANYVNLSKDFVNYAKGLPLALKVLGSSLFAKRLNEWKSALYKLKEEPNRNILDILQISFDGLTYLQKGLFLDIACFFKGENKDCIRNILESFYYSLDYDIGVLMDKSLITIDDHGTLWMHDLLQDMGQEIVRHESPREPGGRSRLWIYDDVIHVLKNNTGTEVVEGIMLNMPIQEVEHLSAEVFSKMKILRLLIIGNMKLPKGFINGTMKLPKVLIRGNVHLPKDLSYLSNELRIIEWHGYPFKSMPTSFQPNKLVEIRMHCSRIIQLWKGIMILDALKLMDLSDSQYLIEIPDLSGAPKLKQLILRHCKGDLLSTILRHYIIEGCYNLNRFTYLTIPGMCAVYIFRQHHAFHQLHINDYEGAMYTHGLLCSIKANGYGPPEVWLPLTEEFGKIESYHLWLEYIPFESRWKEELDANEFTQIEVTFEPETPGLEVMKCGVHLIFEQDIEDLNQSSCTITPYYEDDDLGDSEKDTKIKESCDDEPPHPKWTEHPNLIENWIGNLCIHGQGDFDCE
ncbi:hypothetical protein CMV_025720 [Castanea mollissima]|uniref:TIR domain-containing protein n=1 Tax=Castanea mollissima TaxID=60419 RepID=A0A8J4QNX5_9ROSI|nr:hypothetical protein CMV_025720 [Castanea mollissima]